jgi:MSHA type pilus biogenesis protein MshL
LGLGLLAGCANQPPVAPRAASGQPLIPPVRSQEPFITGNIKELEKLAPPAPLSTPDYQPVSDDVSPARTRLVNIQARNTALGDILHVIADAAGLNLIIGDGVQQDRPITITLKRVTADDALATILNSADYFYTVRDNILSVEATGTKAFELGQPALIQGYSVDVGGDILGSAAGLTAGSSGSSGSGSGGSGATNIKGTVTQTVKHDSKAFDFWESLEKSLQTLLNNRDKSASTQTTATGSGTGQQSVVINRLTGTIVVTATRRNLGAIEQYLDLLKAALNRQVLVEARVIEVQLDDSLKFGIDWDFLDSIRWFNASGTIAGGFGNAANSATNASTSGTFRLGYSGGNVQSLLTALKTQGEVKTLSNPRINVMNGQTALLTVGRNYNYISKITSTTTTGVTNPVTTFSVDTSNVLSGMMIGLAPIINSKGEISMSVTPIISDLVKLEEKIIGSDATNQFIISIPTVDLRELSTTVKVRNGEMIVIGGLISNKQDQVDEKVPFIGDIPWFGTLFSRKNYQDKRSELVVVLQPYLIGNN